MGHKSSRREIRKFFVKYARPNIRILEVGSRIPEEQRNNYRNRYYLYTEYYNIEYIGMDIEDGENVDLVVKDPYDWKEIPDEGFDLVIATQVLEHVEFFWIVFKEMVRVLKRKGYMCVIVPSICHMHRFPVDCWRFLPDGMAALAKYMKINLIRSWCKAPANRLIGDNKINDCVGVFQKP